MADTSTATTTTEQLTVTIDGKQLQATPGELIIEAAERAGAFIPRFCYHPRMKPVGMCRMCLVEVSGPRGPSLQPACFVTVADGQEIETESPAAKKAQEGVLEFLLVNHPLDCPVCDKGGECPLQDQAVSHGPGESRFIEEKRHWAKPIVLGPLTLLDRERCIQCARCTRFAEEIAGEPQIDFFARGDAIEVATFPDQPFTSYFAGNTIQICPVGALTSVPYRFKSRPWDLEQVETTCTFCAVGCRTALQSSAGRLVRQLGIDSAPVNQSWLCDRGRYGYEAVESPRRLTEPSRREAGGERVAVSWGEALAEVGEALRRATSSPAGAASVGIVGGARLANEDQYAWSKLARAVVGTDNVDAQLGDGLPALLVSSLPQATIDEACQAKAVVLLGADLHEELPVLFLRLRTAAAHDGLAIVDCSPVPSALSEVAAAVVPSAPGEEAEVVDLLLGKRNVESPGDQAARARADALGRAREVLDGLAGEEIVVVLGRPSLAAGIASLAAASAALVRGREGVRFLPALRRANVRGAIDMGLAPGMLPGRVTLAAGREWYESQWGPLPSSPGLDTRAMLEAAASGDLEVLILLGADPLADFPDRDLATRALEHVGFLVAIDTLPTASTQLADVVLPAAGWAERGGTTTNIEGRVTRLAQKVVPPGVARSDWVIACEIAERLGYELGFDHLEGIWEEIEEVSPAHRGVTCSAVYGPAGEDGIVVPLGSVPLGSPADATFRRSSIARIDPMATPGISSVNEQGAPMFAGAAVIGSGGVAESIAIEAPAEDEDFVADGGAGGEEDGRGAEDEERGGEDEGHGGEDEETLLETGGPARPSPAAFDAGSWPEPARQAADAYSFRLVTTRTLYDHGSLVQASPSLAPLAPPLSLRVRPKALEQLGVDSGDEVRVRSARGSLVVEAIADEAVPQAIAVLGVNHAGVEEPGLTALVDSDEQVQTIWIETVGRTGTVDGTVED